MRLLFILIPFLFSTATLLGQVTADDTAALRATIHNFNEQIVYVRQSIDLGNFNSFIEARQYMGITDGTLYNSITLTQQEVDEIRQQIRQNKSFVWPENMFPNAESVSKDSMFIVANGSTMKKMANTDKAASNKAKHNPYYNHAFVLGFSKPIYIRKGTICLICTAFACDYHCGESRLAFYQKANGIWKEWVEISNEIY